MHLAGGVQVDPVSCGCAPVPWELVLTWCSGGVEFGFFRVVEAGFGVTHSGRVACETCEENQ
jgi:hypothetical protein